MDKMKILFLASTVILASCRSGQEPDTAMDSEIRDSLVEDEPIAVSEEIMGDIVYSFSSIFETPALIKDLGVPYSNGFLSAAGNIHSYTDNFKRAFIMGVLGTGLGYMNIFNQTAAVPNYVAALRQLTDSLAVGHLFDFTVMEGMAGADEDPGSLMYSYMQSYNRAGEHLREKKMTHLSTAMVSGVWLESLYLLTRAAGSHPGEELLERIGEQKIVLNDLVLILRNHERSHPEFAQLTAELSSIKEEFDKVEIIYEVDEPQAVEQDGMLVIVQNQHSTVNISDEQIENITRKSENIRNQLIL